MTKFDALKTRYPNLIPVHELRSNVSIVELALHYGYQLQVHKGRSRPVLVHAGYHDTIIIKNLQDKGKQVYHQVGNFVDAGTIIDFIRHRLSTVFSAYNQPQQSEFRNIINVLYGYLQIEQNHLKLNPTLTIWVSESDKKQAFKIEQFDLQPLEKDNYLTRRHISPYTLNSPEFINKILAQITYYDPNKRQSEPFLTVKENLKRNYIQFKNIAFLYTNGLSTKVTGLELRNEDLKLHAPGSDRSTSVFVSNPPPKAERFYVMESAIDALSHRQLRSLGGDDAFNSVYFSTGGQLTPQQVNTIISYMAQFTKSPKWQLHLAFDNDTKGYLYDLQFIHQLVKPKFPLQSIPVGLNRIGYQLPQEEIYRSLQKALLDQIVTYNRDVEAQIPPNSGSVSSPELSSRLITIRADKSPIVVSIPESIEALLTVSRVLLTLTQLDERIQIEKSLAKDFNQELMEAIRP